MPWDETADYIRSGHKSMASFDSDSMRTINIDAEKGIKAIVGCPKGEYDKSAEKCKTGTQVQSYLFDKSKGWTMSKAKDWYNSHKEMSFFDWVRFWKEAEESLPARILIVQESTGHRRIREQRGDNETELIGFRFSALAAVPGKSLSNRIYTRDLLEKAADRYAGKPFILDHNIFDSNKVVGIISTSEYGARETKRGPKEGLWCDGVGLMEADLFLKMSGYEGAVPPLIRNVSIGGEGEGQWDPSGALVLTDFMPNELSITAFPGITEAEIVSFEKIRESYLRSGVKSMPEQVISEEQLTKGTTPKGTPANQATDYLANLAKKTKESVREGKVKEQPSGVGNKPPAGVVQPKVPSSAQGEEDEEEEEEEEEAENPLLKTNRAASGTSEEEEEEEEQEQGEEKEPDVCPKCGQPMEDHDDGQCPEAEEETKLPADLKAALEKHHLKLQNTHGRVYVVPATPSRSKERRIRGKETVPVKSHSNINAAGTPIETTQKQRTAVERAQELLDQVRRDYPDLDQNRQVKEAFKRGYVEILQQAGVPPK